MLARTLGRSVRELLATVDAAELAEWEAFYGIEPWGDERADLRSALVCCILANQWRDKGSPAKLKDFLPDFWREESAQSNVAKMLAVGRAFAAATKLGTSWPPKEICYMNDSTIQSRFWQ